MDGERDGEWWKTLQKSYPVPKQLLEKFEKLHFPRLSKGRPNTTLADVGLRRWRNLVPPMKVVLKEPQTARDGKTGKRIPFHRFLVQNWWYESFSLRISIKADCVERTAEVRKECLGKPEPTDWTEVQNATSKCDQRCPEELGYDRGGGMIEFSCMLVLRIMPKIKSA